VPHRNPLLGLAWERCLPALLSIAVGAGFLRCWRLSFPFLSGDEGFTWALIRFPPSEIMQRTALDVHPPLGYLVLHAWTSLWGTSPGALRGCSAFWGLLAIPLLYLLCLEAVAVSNARVEAPPRNARSSAVFAAALMAVHLTQVAQSRNARMYSIGVFLTCLSAWLLLRALRARRQQELWWSAYGLVVAAFCYTHYYAFFTVLAQTAFAAAFLLHRGWRHSWREALAPAAGFAFAGAIALLLYTPWFSVLWAQIREVRRDYWTPSLTLQGVRNVFFSWSAGMPNPQLWEFRVWLAFLAAVGLWLAVRGGWPAWFFLLQAALPWAASLGLSVSSGRSIFIERYLVFAHVGLLGLWGLAWSRLPGLPERLILGGLVLLPCLYGLATALEKVPDAPPAIQEAGEYLHDHARPDDVLVGNHASLFQLLCYASRSGGPLPRLYSRVDPFHPNTQMDYTPALRPDEMAWPDGETAADPPARCWTTSGGSQPPFPKMKLLSERTFQGGGGSQYHLYLFVREAEVPLTPNPSPPRGRGE
jgi:mannosyltransferase